MTKRLSKSQDDDSMMLCLSKSQEDDSMTIVSVEEHRISRVKGRATSC
jgi:hypothetical protein